MLPELIKWYRKDFETIALNDASVITSRNEDPDITLLLQLEPFFYPNVADKFQKMLPNIREVIFSSSSWRFGYKFDVSVLETSTSSSSLQRSSSAPESLYQSTDFESSIVSRKSLGMRGKYRMNKSILEYLERSSPLMAALVSLVCPIPSETTEKSVKEKMVIENKTSEGKSVTLKKNKDLKTEKIQELPFKVTLQRIDRFKALQRYLVARLYPIAELITENSREGDVAGSFSSSSYEFIREDSRFQKSVEIPEISLFPLTLAAEEDTELQKAFLIGSDFYLCEGNFEYLLEIISSSDMLGDGRSGSRIDFLFTAAILSRGGKPEFSRLDVALYELGLPDIGRSHMWQEKPWTLLPQIQDNDQLARLVLSSIHQWKAHVCLDVLRLCLSRRPSNCAFVVELERKRREIMLFQKVSTGDLPFKFFFILHPLRKTAHNGRISDMCQVKKAKCSPKTNSGRIQDWPFWLLKEP